MGKARILSLADGSMTMLPRNVPAGAQREVTLAGFFDFFKPSAFKPRRAIAAPKRRGLSDEYVATLGDSLERLASMTLARKLRSPESIGPGEAAEMVGLAGVPDTAAGRILTSRILQASAEELGKGGVIGSISKAVSTAAKKTIVPASALLAKTAPLLSNIPVIGPMLSTGVKLQNNVVQAVGHGNLKSVTSGGIGGLVTKIAGGAGAVVGGVAALGGSAVQGIVEAPGVILSDLGAAGSWLGGEASDIANSIGGYLGGGSGSGGFFSAIAQGGRSLYNAFGSGVSSSIEAVNPALSGELTAIFHGLGSTYTSFASTFDAWSKTAKAAPTNTAFVGRQGQNIYTVTKDASGHMSVTQTPLSQAPAAAASIPEGSFIPASQLSGYGVAQPAAGSGYGPSFWGKVMGAATNPAGMSLPGGPINIDGDATSQALLAQATEKANAGKSPAFQMASLPTWAAIGLGLAAVAMVAKGGVKLGPTHRRRGRR